MDMRLHDGQVVEEELMRVLEMNAGDAQPPCETVLEVLEVEDAVEIEE